MWLWVAAVVAAVVGIEMGVAVAVVVGWHRVVELGDVGRLRGLDGREEGFGGMVVG
jgi:hypothetical protein